MYHCLFFLTYVMLNRSTSVLRITCSLTPVRTILETNIIFDLKALGDISRTSPTARWSWLLYSSCWLSFIIKQQVRDNKRWVQTAKSWIKSYKAGSNVAPSGCCAQGIWLKAKADVTPSIVCSQSSRYNLSRSSMRPNTIINFLLQTSLVWGSHHFLFCWSRSFKALI